MWSGKKKKFFEANHENKVFYGCFYVLGQKFLLGAFVLPVLSAFFLVLLGFFFVILYYSFFSVF